MTTKGCVLIHGFTGSPKEIEILANHLEQRGVLVSTPTLPGHGYPIYRKQMEKYGREDWLNEAENAVKEMIEKADETYLVGFSMGGMISAYLATKYPIKKLILLSASVFYMNIQHFSRDIIEGIRNRKMRDNFRRYIYKFKSTPVQSAFHFRSLVKELKPYIEKINVPTLIIQGEKDDLVDPKSANYIYDSIQSKEKHLHFLPNSKHIICLEPERENVVEFVDSFIFSEPNGGELGEH